MAKRFALGVDVTNVKIIDIHKVIQTVGDLDNVTELWLLTSNPSKTVFPVPKTMPMIRAGHIYKYPSIYTAILELSEDGDRELEIITATCAIPSTHRNQSVDIAAVQLSKMMNDSNYLLGGSPNRYSQQMGGMSTTPIYGQVAYQPPVSSPLSLSELCAEFKLHAFFSGTKENSMFFGENHPTKFEYFEALSNESDDQMDALNLVLTSF